MSMRFKAGERAKFVVAVYPEEMELVGQECVIEVVGPIKAGAPIRHPIIPWVIGTVTVDCDYIALFGQAIAGIPHDWQLQKPIADDEPASMHRDETIEEEVPA